MRSATGDFTPRALADAPADVEAGQVAHRERPHREAEVGEHLVDLVRQRALQDAASRPAGRAGGACGCRRSRSTRRRAPAPCRCAGRPSSRWRSSALDDFLPRTISSSRMTLAGLKKCMPITLSGRLVARGDLVDVERGGVGRQHRAGLGQAVEPGEDLLLDRHLLEHGLDDDVGVARRPSKSVVPVMRPMRFSTSAWVSRPRAGRAPRSSSRTMPRPRSSASWRDLDHGDRDARVGEVHGDAAAHGAGADHRRPS